MDTTQLLSPDFLDKTFGLIKPKYLNGVYNTNVNVRSYILDLIKRDKLIMNMLLEFIKEYPAEDWDWDIVSFNSNINSDTFDLILGLNPNWRNFSMNKNLTLEYIEDNMELFNRYNIPEDWKTIFISNNPNVTLQDIIDVNTNRDLEFRSLSYNKNITIDFIRSNIDEDWEWFQLSKNFKMSEIEENSDLPWDWYGVSINPNLTIEYVKNNMEKEWFWQFITENSNISLEDIENNPTLPWSWDTLVLNDNLTIEFIKKYPNEEQLKKSGNSEDFEWNIEYVSAGPLIQLEDIENNPNLEWDFSIISRNPNLTVDFYEKYKDLEYRMKIFPNSTQDFDFMYISLNEFDV